MIKKEKKHKNIVKNNPFLHNYILILPAINWNSSNKY